MLRFARTTTLLLAPIVMSTASAAVLPITAANASANNRQTFNAATDVWAINIDDFAVNGPMVFASAVAGDPGVLGTALDDSGTFASDANVIVVRNFDSNDPNGFPANWDNSFNARTALRAIASNTEGDRAGFFLYWNEKLGVNRLVYTANLNNGEAALQILFAINSANLTSNTDDLALVTTFRAEANANFNTLGTFTAANFAFVPAPGAAAVLGLGCLAANRRRR